MLYIAFIYLFVCVCVFLNTMMAACIFVYLFLTFLYRFSAKELRMVYIAPPLFLTFQQPYEVGEAEREQLAQGHPGSPVAERRF